jgi:hypothetical protein
VRLDLQAERPQLRPRELCLESRLPQFQAAGAMVCRQRAPADEQQHVQEEIDDELSRELAGQHRAEVVRQQRSERLHPDGELCGGDAVDGQQPCPKQHQPEPIGPPAPATRGERGSPAQHEGRCESPERPGAQLPHQDAAERMPVPEHREIRLGRYRQRENRRDADADGHHRWNRNLLVGYAIRRGIDQGL